MFDIEQATNISIVAHNEDRYEIAFSGYPDLVNRTMFELAFEEHGSKGYYLNRFMEGWKEILDFLKDKDSKISTQMYELWKRDQLEKASKVYCSDTSVLSDILDGIDEGLPFL